MALQRRRVTSLARPAKSARTRRPRRAGSAASAAAAGGGASGSTGAVSLSPRKLSLLYDAVHRLSSEEVGVVGRLVDLDGALREAVMGGLARTVRSLERTPAGTDPLADLDDPLDPREAVTSALLGEIEAHRTRNTILRNCIAAAEASELVGRSRQGLERSRRAGKLIALRVGNQWRYPRWQFEPDAPGGVVAGLGEAIDRLGLSPAGAAFWLTQPTAALAGRAPIQALRQGQREAVLRAAEEAGRLP